VGTNRKRALTRRVSVDTGQQKKLKNLSKKKRACKRGEKGLQLEK